MQCGDYTYRAIDTGAEIMEYYGQGGEITLPETLDSLPVVSVGLCAFIMRTDLTAVTLPKTLRHIGNHRVPRVRVLHRAARSRVPRFSDSRRRRCPFGLHRAE